MAWHQIPRKTFADVVNGGWIRDNVITVAMHLLTTQNPTTRALVLDTNFWPAAQKSATSLPTASYNRVTAPLLTPGALDVVLVPINYKNSHWALGVLWPAARAVTVYDSFQRNTYHGLRRGATEQTLVQWARQRTEDPTWHVRAAPNAVPQQLDDRNCGIFMLLFAEHVLRGNRAAIETGALDTTDDALTHMRRALALELIRSLHGRRSAPLVTRSYSEVESVEKPAPKPKRT